MDLGSVLLLSVSKYRICIVFKVLELKSIFEVSESHKKGSRSDPFQITSEKKDLDQDPFQITSKTNKKRSRSRSQIK